MQEGKSKILASLPSTGIELDNLDLEIRGQILNHLLGDIIQNMHMNGFSQEELAQSVIQGTCTFLFDTDGNFITESYVSSNS